jgi:hypothetical protein
MSRLATKLSVGLLAVVVGTFSGNKGAGFEGMPDGWFLGWDPELTLEKAEAELQACFIHRAVKNSLTNSKHPMNFMLLRDALKAHYGRWLDDIHWNGASKSNFQNRGNGSHNESS